MYLCAVPFAKDELHYCPYTGGAPGCSHIVSAICRFGDRVRHSGAFPYGGKMKRINLTLDEDFVICVEGVPVMDKAIAESLSGLSEKAEENVFKFAEFREQAAATEIIIPYADPLLRITHLLECINQLKVSE